MEIEIHPPFEHAKRNQIKEIERTVRVEERRYSKSDREETAKSKKGSGNHDIGVHASMPYHIQQWSDAGLQETGCGDHCVVILD